MNRKISLIRSTNLASVDYAYASHVPADMDLLFLADRALLIKKGKYPRSATMSFRRNFVWRI